MCFCNICTSKVQNLTNRIHIFLFRQVINQTMEVDIPQYANMNASTGRKLKKLLAVIAFGLLY